MNVCVFCGSSSGNRPAYGAAARAFGEVLARRGDTLVYGGGNVGLMGILADAVLAHGGSVVGVMPDQLVQREIAHRALTELRVVDTMHERKKVMASLADAFVLLPGGFGSWDEFCEAVTWLQLGLHQKPCGVLNVGNYYTPLLQLIDQSVREGFVRSSDQASIVVDEDCERLLNRLSTAPVMESVKWASSASAASR